MSNLLRITQLGKKKLDCEYSSLYAPLRRGCQGLSQLEKSTELFRVRRAIKATSKTPEELSVESLPAMV